MNFSVASVLLAICLVAQAKSINKSTLLDYYKQNKSRIISGQLAKSGQFPYQVAIWCESIQGRDAFCGGTLISSRWVLTAAHCVKSYNSWDIKLGGLLFDKNETDSLLLRSKNVIIHPGYGIFTNNDLALIQLPQEVNLTDTIQPVRLPAKSDPRVGAGVKARVSGWGKITDSPEVASPNLTYADVDTISNTQCALVYGPLTVIRSTLCAEGQSPCGGDSGGPLTVTESDGLPTLIGTVSFFRGADCAGGHPSGYARIASFLDWISKNTGIPIRS